VVFVLPELIRISWGKLLKCKVEQVFAGGVRTCVAVGSMFWKPGEVAADREPCSLHFLIGIFGRTLEL